MRENPPVEVFAQAYFGWEPPSERGSDEAAPDEMSLPEFEA